MVGIVIELVFGFMMEVIMYGIGRAAICILSLGYARAENFREALTIDGYGQPATGRAKIIIPAWAATLAGVAVFSIASILYFSA